EPRLCRIREGARRQLPALCPSATLPRSRTLSNKEALPSHLTDCRNCSAWGVQSPREEDVKLPRPRQSHYFCVEQGTRNRERRMVAPFSILCSLLSVPCSTEIIYFWGSFLGGGTPPVVRTRDGISRTHSTFLVRSAISPEKFDPHALRALGSPGSQER